MEYLKNLETLECQLYLASLKEIMSKLLCDLGASVSVMPFSLYKRLDLNKLTPTEISLQMADKSTAIPIGICEDVSLLLQMFLS